MDLKTGDLSVDFRSVVVLTVIAIASAASLGLIHDLTEERIAQAEEQQVEDALEKIFPSAAEKKDLENQVYRMIDENGDNLGYAGIAEGRGYGGFTGGFIKLAVGIDNGEIVRVRIIKQSETPGLGSRITSKDFLKPFGDNIKIIRTMDNLELEKNGGKIEAITGATISSQAVVDIVRDKVKQMREQLRWT